MNNFLKEFEKVLSQLEKTSQVRINCFEINDPLKELDIEAIERRYQVEIESSIKEFYLQVNGLKFEWELLDLDEGIQKNDDNEVGGSIRILEILQVFGGFDGEGWYGDIWFDWMSDEEKEKRKKLKPFDYFYSEDSQCVCFLLEDGLLQPKMVLHSVDYGIRELGVNLSEYLNLLLETGGFFSWQLAISKGEKPVHKRNSYLSNLHYYIPKILPNSRLEKFPKLK